MLRRPVLLLAVLMLMACTISSQAQVLSLDKCLDDLAEKGSLGPVVAVMRGPAPGTADLSSLEGLAKTFGLKLFEQDGIHVLGPEECLHPYDLSSYFPKEPRKQGLSPEDELFISLTPEQLRSVGSRDGLPFAGLSGKQQSIVRRMFTGRITLLKRTGEPPNADDLIPPPPTLVTEGDTLSPPSLPNPLRDTERITLSSIPIEELTMTGSLAYGQTLIDDDSSDERGCSLPGPDVPLWDPAEYDLAVRAKPESALPAPPRPFGPNMLKPSQLDYERRELQEQAEFPTRTTLRDVVAVAAKESGLPLFVGPGSEQVALYVKADILSIGQVLKAVSLATGGTWRKVGDLFVYTLDLTGLGSFERRAYDLEELSEAVEECVGPPFDALKVRDVMLNLPPKVGTTFLLTPQQITDLTTTLAENPSEDACRIPWGALTPEQQAATLNECDYLKSHQPDQLYLTPEVSAELSFHFPAVGNANTGYVPAKREFYFDLLPPDEPSVSPEFERRIWPKGSKIPMPSGTRGLLYKVSKADTPASVVASMAKYGFNTLLIRIFSDGYTVFPSRQFPQFPGLKADDFLRNVIAVAHARGIKVVGVIDALRWSDGDPKHWLYKSPELIDRDIAGRMNTEWMAERTVLWEEAMQERLGYGDAFDGDFVTPFDPLISEKLSALVDELARYDLDGLAFDHTAIIHPSGWHELERPGQTGYNDLARTAFVHATGADPIDITDQDTVQHLPPTPLSPIAVGAVSLAQKWDALYRAACDALLDILIEESCKAKPGVPIWVVDTYRGELAFEILEAHDWSKFQGRINMVVGWGSADEPDYAGRETKAAQLVRITDAMDPLYIASHIALVQNKTFPGMLGEDDLSLPPETPINDIILDFPCSETRKTEFLKLLETARPEKAPKKSP